MPDPIRFRFTALISDLGKISNTFRIPRRYFTGEKVKTLQLHGFSEASELAYTCVLYLRVEYETGKVDVRFVSSKSKVAPIKKQTIPRLELMSAKLIAKLVNTVRNALQASLKDFETFYWTDSLATLCLIHNQKPWKQFVMDGVIFHLLIYFSFIIRQLSNKDHWRFCHGTLNSADLPIRGKYGRDLSSNKLCREGPEFLKQSREHWPENLSTGDIDQGVVLQEQQKNPPSITHTMQHMASSASPQMKTSFLTILDISRFSKRSRLVRTLAWVLRFIHNLKACKHSKVESNKSQILNASELKQSEHLIIISVQAEAFSKELKYLLNPKEKEGYVPPYLCDTIQLIY